MQKFSPFRCAVFFGVVLLFLMGCRPSALSPAPNGWTLHDSLPLWHPRSDSAIVCGRFVSSDTSQLDFISVFSNSASFTDNVWDFNFQLDHPRGSFRFVVPLAYPITLQFGMGKISTSVLVCPGDSLHLEYNLDSIAALNHPEDSLWLANMRNHVDMKRRSCRISGRSALTDINLIISTAPFYKYAGWGCSVRTQGVDSALTYKSFAAEVIREYHQFNREIDTISWLSGAQQEYLHLVLDFNYIQKMQLFRFLKECQREGGIQFTDAQIANYEEEMETYRDTLLPRLRLIHSPKFAYIINNSKYRPYLERNGATGSSLYRWMKEFDQARTAVKRINSMHPYPETETFESFALQFRAPLCSLNKSTRIKQEEMKRSSVGIARNQPLGNPSDYLQDIISSHPDRPVLIDFWATWCGPCMQGMKEMEQVKEKWEKKGYQFVYITDDSSPIATYSKIVTKHRGNFYRIPRELWSEMQIPNYKGSIPHYLIYNARHELVESISGWSNLKDMEKRLEKGLEK